MKLSDLQKDALQKFNCLYKELDDTYHKLALRAGLSDSAFCVLYAVATLGDGCLQKDISEYFSLSRQTINTSIKNLQEKGYLTLVRIQGRDKHIHLTPAGQQFVSEKIIPVIEMENAAFDEMLPKEREEFLTLTEKYIHLFQQKIEKFL